MLDPVENNPNVKLMEQNYCIWNCLNKSDEKYAPLNIGENCTTVNKKYRVCSHTSTHIIHQLFENVYNSLLQKMDLNFSVSAEVDYFLALISLIKHTIFTEKTGPFSHQLILCRDT